MIGKTNQSNEISGLQRHGLRQSSGASDGGAGFGSTTGNGGNRFGVNRTGATNSKAVCQSRQTAGWLYVNSLDTVMKTITLLLLALTLAVQQLPAQMPDAIQDFANNDRHASYAPLNLFINGSGTVFPFHDGQMLHIRLQYSIVAVPDPGYIFTNWTKVVVFTFTEITINAQGQPNPPITSTVLSSVPTNIRSPRLEFTMQPEEVIYNDPGVRIITEGIGWQANFVSARKFWPVKNWPRK